MADTFIVGRTIGVQALAAVGSTGSIVFLIIGFATGLTAGLAIPLAQRFGAKDYKGVKHSFLCFHFNFDCCGDCINRIEYDFLSTNSRNHADTIRDY